MKFDTITLSGGHSSDHGGSVLSIADRPGDAATHATESAPTPPAEIQADQVGRSHPEETHHSHLTTAGEDDLIVIEPAVVERYSFGSSSEVHGTHSAPESKAYPHGSSPGSQGRYAYCQALLASKNPSGDLHFEEMMATLNVSLPQDRKLCQEFEAYTKAHNMALRALRDETSWRQFPRAECHTVAGPARGPAAQLKLAFRGIRRYQSSELPGAIFSAADFAGCYTECMPTADEAGFEQTYLGQRLNVLRSNDTETQALWRKVVTEFPGDGLIDYIGEEAGYHCYRYWEGPNDRIFMQKLDESLLSSLVASHNTADREHYECIVKNLDMRQTHHQTLSRRFKFDALPSYEPAGGGTSGGPSGGAEVTSCLPGILVGDERGATDRYDPHLGPRLKTGQWGLWLSAVDGHDKNRIASGFSAFEGDLALNYAKTVYSSPAFKYAYIGQRLNASPPTDEAQASEWMRIITTFPADGRIEHVDKQGDYHIYRYVEGPQDKLFMEQQDARYLEQLAKSDNKEDKDLLRALIRQLDLKLPHHRQLQGVFLRNTPPARLKTNTQGQRNMARLALPYEISRPTVIAGCSFFGRTEAAHFVEIYKDTYVGNRLNTKTLDTPRTDQDWHLIVEDFPADGWVIRIEGSETLYRYIEGERDRLYMERQDKRYVKELADSDNPRDKAVLAQLIVNLDGSSEHHRELQGLFRPRPARTLDRTGGEVVAAVPYAPRGHSDTDEIVRTLSAGQDARIAELEASFATALEQRRTDRQGIDGLRIELERLKEQVQANVRVIAEQAVELRCLKEASENYATGVSTSFFRFSELRRVDKRSIARQADELQRLRAAFENHKASIGSLFSRHRSHEAPQSEEARAPGSTLAAHRGT